MSFLVFYRTNCDHNICMSTLIKALVIRAEISRAVFGTFFFFRVGRIHWSRDSTGCFGRDSATTGHQRTGVIHNGTPRGIQQPRDITAVFMYSGVLQKTQSMVHLPMANKIHTWWRRRRCCILGPDLDWAVQNRAAKTDTSGLIGVVVLTLTHHRHYVVSGNRTGSRHSGVEEYLRGKKKAFAYTRTLVKP